MDHLEPPKDSTKRLLSPPCSPLPEDWRDWEEEAPQKLEEFDLDAPTGKVTIGPGKVIQVGVEEGFRRKGILEFGKEKPVIVIDSYE